MVTFMRGKAFEMVLVWLIMMLVLPGCAAVQPAAPLVDGDVYNLFQGTARWVASGGVITKTFFNSATGVLVHARPLEDGFAVACESVNGCSTIAGYLINVRTWNDLKVWMTGAGGFVEVVARGAVTNVKLPTIIIMPAILLEPATMERMAMCSAGFGVYNDMGECVGVRQDYVSGYEFVEGTWTQLP